MKPSYTRQELLKGYVPPPADLTEEELKEGCFMTKKQYMERSRIYLEAVKKGFDPYLRSVPPQVGEYAYTNLDWKERGSHQWIVRTEKGEFGCHYSMNSPYAEWKNKSWCYGKVLSVVRLIEDRSSEKSEMTRFFPTDVRERRERRPDRDIDDVLSSCWNRRKLQKMATPKKASKRCCKTKVRRKKRKQERRRRRR